MAADDDGINIILKKKKNYRRKPISRMLNLNVQNRHTQMRRHARRQRTRADTAHVQTRADVHYFLNHSSALFKF